MWPTPKDSLLKSEAVWLSPDVTVKQLETSEPDFCTLWASGTEAALPKLSYVPLPAVSSPPQDAVVAAFERFKNAVFKEELFVPEKFYPRTTSFEPDLSLPKAVVKKILLESLTKESSINAPEAYILKLSEKNITIQASYYLGFVHAFTTLQQLFYNHSQSMHEAYTFSSPITIHDAPSFAHRGLNLDISRNRIFPSDVLRTLGAMAFCKLNRLHLHATDSQSWPLDIPSMPELAAKGAYSPSQIWTEVDLLTVQKFGAERGIEVHLEEIDMPGHMGAVWHSHPDLTVGYGLQWDKYAVEPPAGQLKLAKPEVKTFIGAVLDDVLPRSKPYSPLFHLGMDELNLNPYRLEPGLETSDKAALQPYLQAFLSHVFARLSAHGLTPVAWEEIVLDWDLDVPRDTVVQTWRTGAALTKVLEKGHRALFGAATHWYLDTGLGTFLDPDPAKDGGSGNGNNGNDNNNGNSTGSSSSSTTALTPTTTPSTTATATEKSPVKPPYHDWIPPFKNFRLVLSYDPLAGVPAHLRPQVLGGEAHLWGELTDSISLDGMLWPRAAAAAEVLWAGRGRVGEDSTRRLAEWRERAVLAGVRAGVVQMEWILRNKGGGLL